MRNWWQTRRFGSTNADLMKFWGGLKARLDAEDAADSAYLEGLL